ncbi:MAG TPA: DUF5060 domain-containing protein, partial [Candidatus Kapabacteria bacterium]|nr:DUF5060 domain-containing protein [Candidatus Kapabacteria bacterium]
MLKKIYATAFLFVVLLFLNAAAFASVNTIGKYNALDIPIPFSQTNISNVWDNVKVTATFTSPTQRVITTGGFYHSQDLWMVRFAPDETGTWNFTVHIAAPNNRTYDSSGSFNCVTSSNRGFVRKDPNNPKRLIYEADGGLFDVMGFGDCTASSFPPGGFDSLTGGMDGAYRPCGYHEGVGWLVPISEYLTAYGDVAGFGVYRYSDGNCAYSMISNISSSGNSYNTVNCLWTDTMFAALRAHGFRIYMTIMTSPRGSSSDTAQMAAVNRYAQFCIDRFGALVDFWELTNESYPDSLWVADVANYIHAHDPYHHLVSVNWQLPLHPSIDIISLHRYGKESNGSSDVTVQGWAQPYDTIPKPVIIGEQGDGAGHDSTSDIRMRGRIWSAFFQQVTIIFWNTSYAYDCCNQYLADTARRYARVLRNFADQVDSGVATGTLTVVLPSSGFRAWSLTSPRLQAVYLCGTNATTSVSLDTGVTVNVNPPVAGTATWYDVHTGKIISSTSISAGAQRITAPPFVSDIA